MTITRVQKILAGGSILLVAALIAWQALKGGMEEIGYGTTSMSAGIPVGPVIVTTALLAGLLAAVALVTAIRLATGR